eukprot:6314148-Pyramimonas_sp.AAC.1
MSQPARSYSNLLVNLRPRSTPAPRRPRARSGRWKRSSTRRSRSWSAGARLPRCSKPPSRRWRTSWTATSGSTRSSSSRSVWRWPR